MLLTDIHIIIDLTPYSLVISNKNISANFQALHNLCNIWELVSPPSHLLHKYSIISNNISLIFIDNKQKFNKTTRQMSISTHWCCQFVWQLNQLQQQTGGRAISAAPSAGRKLLMENVSLTYPFMPLNQINYHMNSCDGKKAKKRLKINPLASEEENTQQVRQEKTNRKTCKTHCQTSSENWGSVGMSY